MVFISVALGSYAFLFIALKNICSEGYIQFPVVLSAPVSPSLFAGFDAVGPPSFAAAVSRDVGVARGMEETSRWVPRRREARMPGGDVGVDVLGFWSSCVESQPSAWRGECGDCGGGAAALAACALARACLSHASRVLSSTGQAAAEEEESGGDIRTGRDQIVVCGALGDARSRFWKKFSVGRNAGVLIGCMSDGSDFTALEGYIGSGMQLRAWSYSLRLGIEDSNSLNLSFSHLCPFFFPIYRYL